MKCIIFGKNIANSLQMTELSITGVQEYTYIDGSLRAVTKESIIRPAWPAGPIFEFSQKVYSIVTTFVIIIILIIMISMMILVMRKIIVEITTFL